MEIIQETREGNTVGIIYIDENCESPRVWDNVFTLAIKDNRYVRGDEELTNDGIGEHIHIFKVYANVHSGISLSVSPMGCVFDSGQIGYAYSDDETMDEDTALTQILAELDTYECYLNGECYGYEVYEEKRCECCGQTIRRELESMSGYYGLEDAEVNMDYEMKRVRMVC